MRVIDVNEADNYAFAHVPGPSSWRDDAITPEVLPLTSRIRWCSIAGALSALLPVWQQKATIGKYLHRCALHARRYHRLAGCGLPTGAMRTPNSYRSPMVILGCIFDPAHWPGGEALILVGVGALALFYFPFGFRAGGPKPTGQFRWMSSAAAGGWPDVPLAVQQDRLLAVLASVGCGFVAAGGAYKQPRLDIYLDGLLICRCSVVGLVFLHLLFAGKPHLSGITAGSSGRCRSTA